MASLSLPIRLPVYTMVFTSFWSFCFNPVTIVLHLYFICVTGFLDFVCVTAPPPCLFYVFLLRMILIIIFCPLIENDSHYPFSVFLLRMILIIIFCPLIENGSHYPFSVILLRMILNILFLLSY